MEWFDKKAAIGVIFSIASSFAAKIGVYILTSYYETEVTPVFTLESNLLLFQWMGWKIYQILLGYYNYYDFDFKSLVATIAVIAVINAVKVYTLFDYEIIQIVNIFKNNHTKIIEEKEKNPMQVSQTINVFVDHDKEMSEG